MQVRLSEAQDRLVSDGVLDQAGMTFSRDHVFDNWSLASRIVSGKGTYSGAYHWQPIEAEAITPSPETAR